MANLLFNPDLWEVAGVGAWDGSSWRVSLTDEDSGGFRLNFIGSASPGDVVAGDATISWADHLGPHYLSVVDADNNVVLNSAELVEGATTSFSLPAANNSRLIIANNTEAVFPSTYYGLQLTISLGVVGDPYVIRGTHRAYMGSDAKQAAWVRTEAGKFDMSGASSLTVEIKRPWRDRAELTIPAESPELGKLQFTVLAADARKRLAPGLFHLFAKADGRVIYAGLLEILG